MPWLSRSARTPSPSGMMCVAQAQVMLSVSMSMRRVSPVAVGNTRPVKVCTRTGTRHSHAAIMHSSPALGVMECTIVGRSRWNTLTSRHRLRKSRSGDIWRSMGTSMRRTPSYWSRQSQYLPGEASTHSSYSRSNSGTIGATKEMESDTVQARMSLGLLFIFRF